VKSDSRRAELGAAKAVDRRSWKADLDALWVRERAHSREGDAIAGARRRLSVVEVDRATPLIGERGAVSKNALTSQRLINVQPNRRQPGILEVSL
jgi:predicted dithiol-disulfide oxidoreductase (DUF899 family)